MMVSSWVARQVVLKLTKNKTPVSGANILILGFTFKEIVQTLEILR